jgi:hypothetical protein
MKEFLTEVVFCADTPPEGFMLLSNCSASLLLPFFLLAIFWKEVNVLFSVSGRTLPYIQSDQKVPAQ